MTSISGFAEIIQNGIVKPEDIPRFAGNIYVESQRLISLVDDILNLSRLDEGGVGLETAPVDLLELCRRRRLPLLTYSPEELSRAEGEFTPSPFVRQVTGTDNVCERAAVLASGGPLLLKKTAGEGVTAALAAAPFAPGWEEAP